MRYKLTIEYDGTGFHGWQLQPDRRTVQGVLEAAVARLFGQPTRVEAAGRTDAGVHALGQVVAFSAGREIEPGILSRGLNALTPNDVIVRMVETVPKGFDPRRHASSRTYVYRIWNAETPNVFYRKYAWHVRRPLDIDAMRAAAETLLGEHDFTSFRAAGCDAEHAVRRVHRSNVDHERELISYTVEATAFLRHMVRNIAGTLVEVGVGERAPENFRRLLELRDRTQAAATAPARGLCLEDVRYDHGCRGLAPDWQSPAAGRDVVG